VGPAIFSRVVFIQHELYRPSLRWPVATLVVKLHSLQFPLPTHTLWPMGKRIWHIWLCISVNLCVLNWLFHLYSSNFLTKILWSICLEKDGEEQRVKKVDKGERMLELILARDTTYQYYIFIRTDRKRGKERGGVYYACLLAWVNFLTVKSWRDWYSRKG
jgi:hypothetical protein